MKKSNLLNVDISVRLALFMPSFEGGGAERVMISLANEIARRGYVVDLVVLNSIGPYRRYVSEAVRIVSLNAPRARSAGVSLWRYVRSSRPTVVLATLRASILLITLVRWIARLRTKIVVRQASVIEDPAGPLEVLRFYLMYLPVFYRKADKFIALSNDVACTMRSRLRVRNKEIRVIHNPAFIESNLTDGDLSSATVDGVVRENNVPVIVMIGSLKPQKDYPSFLRAFRLVRDVVKCRVVILGDGPLRESLESIIRELDLGRDVLLPGFVDDPLSYLMDADLFVHSAKYEGFGNVIVEALSVGLPIVATDCPGGPREILDNGRYGVLVPVGDVERMAEEILSALARNHSKEERLALKSRADAFRIERIADIYLDYLLT